MGCHRVIHHTNPNTDHKSRLPTYVGGPEVLTMRRMVATPARIEQIITVGLKKGLTPVSVSQYPDGRTVVHFEGAQDAKQATGWEV